jgi:hypothetical protein
MSGTPPLSVIFYGEKYQNVCEFKNSVGKCTDSSLSITVSIELS